MNGKEVFRQINILYFALLAGQILLCLIILFILLDPETRQSGWPEPPFGLVAPILLAVIIPAAYLINQKRIATGADESDLDAKVNHYRSVVIVRSALLEGANLICLVALMLENNLNYLILFALGFLVFLYLRPSLNEFFTHYKLSGAEKNELQ